MIKATSGRIGPLVFAAALLAPALGAPGTVYNNFAGPGHEGWDYNWGLGWTIAGVNVPAQYGVEQAHRIASPLDGVLSDIWVAMWYVPLDPQPDIVTLYLTAATAGQPPRPEDILEQWTITSFESWTQWRPPKHLVGSGGTRLTAGATYWLWAVGGDTTWCGWCHNLNPALTLPHTLRREGENWLPIGNETASALRIDAWRIGDCNCDGAVNFLDINPFVLMLSDPGTWEVLYLPLGCHITVGDINGDQAVDFSDINPFVALLSTE